MVSLPPFLLANLRAIAIAEGLGTDYVLEHEAGSKHGDGFMAAMIAVTLKGKAKGGQQLVLICKLMPENKARQDMFSAQNVFNQEVMFYNEILPMFEELQRKHGLSEKNGFFGYPKCYFASGKPGESVIIMRDLRADGFALWNKLDPIDVSRVRLLIEQLGRVHGLSFVLRDQRPDLFRRIQAVEDVMLPVCGVDPLLGMFMKSYDQAIEILDREDQREVMRRVKAEWRTLMEESMSGQLAEPFAVLAHGDCWNNNMMYQGNQKICLLDWQCCRYVSPVVDLTYYLMSGPDKALRDQHYDQLIRFYYDNLAQTIRLCGSNPDRLFQFADLQQQFRQFGKFGIIMAPLLMQVMVSETKDIAKVDDMANALGTDQEMTSFAVMNDASTQRYRRKLGDSIDDAKRWGWI